MDNIEGKLYHILSELERLARSDKDMIHEIASLRKEVVKDMSDIKIEVAQLQIRAGLWGAIAGAIPVAIVLVLKLIE